MNANVKRPRLVVIGSLLVASVLLGLSGCATINDAINAMNNQIDAGVAQSGSSSSGTSSNTGSGSVNLSGQIALSPQLNFYIMYGVTALFQAYGKGAHYKVGQGTVWNAKTTSSDSTMSTTFEQALLKDNADGSQWWRLKVTSEGTTYLYEYLAKSDGTIEKVRYKDPTTGEIKEFVPDQSKEQQQPEPAAAAQANASNAANGDKVKITKDRQTVTVGAGTFQAEHTTYIDSTRNYRQEVWTSNKVPGALVKYKNEDLSSKDTSQGELVKIESGVTTVLSSY